MLLEQIRSIFLQDLNDLTALWQNRQFSLAIEQTTYRVKIREKDKFMTERFNLIKTEGSLPEKRVLPRYPFSFMTFKSSSQNSHAFEVADISDGGMKLELKDGSHQYRPGDDASGEIHWRNHKLNIIGRVAWTRSQSLGVEFNEQMANNVRDMLQVENVLHSLRPIHATGVDMNIPNNLKYWLRTDGPVEIFFWVHSDGEFKRVQYCLFNKYFEWEDGQGLRTGVITGRKNIESPLNQEDEFTIQFDEVANAETVELVGRISQKLPDNLLSNEAIEFILRKTSLSASAS